MGSRGQAETGDKLLGYHHVSGPASALVDNWARNLSGRGNCHPCFMEEKTEVHQLGLKPGSDSEVFILPIIPRGLHMPKHLRLLGPHRLETRIKCKISGV